MPSTDPDDAVRSSEPAAEETAPSGDFVQSLARGLSIIRCFDAEHPRLSLAEISAMTGLTRATARRFLLTLAQLGYVTSNGRLFSLKAKTLDLGYSYLSSLSLPDLAGPSLEELSAATGESCSISVLDGNDIVYVARVAARRIMTATISIGTALPAYATSMGRVLLAGLPREELAAYLASVELAPLTANTIDSVDELAQDIDIVRARGWSIVDQELEQGLRSLAAPIRGKDGSVIASLNISTTAGTKTLAETREAFLELLLRTAGDIGADLARAPRPGPLR